MHELRGNVKVCRQIRILGMDELIIGLCISGNCRNVVEYRELLRSPQLARMPSLGIVQSTLPVTNVVIPIHPTFLCFWKSTPTPSQSPRMPFKPSFSVSICHITVNCLQLMAVLQVRAVLAAALLSGFTFPVWLWIKVQISKTHCTGAAAGYLVISTKHE